MEVKREFMKEWEKAHDNKGYYNWTETDERIVEMSTKKGYEWAQSESKK